MLEKEFKYYQKNEKKFVKKYLGQVIVIKNEEIIGTYPSREVALRETLKKHELGTFLAHLVEPMDTVLYFNRVYV